MMPLMNTVAAAEYSAIPSGVDMGRLEKIYRGLVDRGLPEADIPVVMSYMIEQSGADPSRDDAYGKGLLDGLEYRDNMFIEDDEDSMLGRQLDSVVEGVLSNGINTVIPLGSTDYGEAILRKIYGTGSNENYDYLLDDSHGWKYAEGGKLRMQETYWPMQNDEGIEKYYKGSPYRNPAIEKGSDGKNRIVGVSDITSSVIGGTDQLLYDENFMKDHSVYLDDRGRYTLIDNRVLPDIKEGSAGKAVSFEELKRKMPTMQYIGGDNYRLRVARLIPGLMEDIQSRADSYGVNPNLILNRMMKEGILDNITRQYNESDDEKKSHFFTDGHLWDQQWEGYDNLGLYDAGLHLTEGRYTLNDPDASWHSDEKERYNEKGRKLQNVPIADNLQTAVEMLAAEMAYRRSVLEKRGVYPEDLDAYTNASYAAGLNSPLLDNRLMVLDKYSVPDWYSVSHSMALGGNIYDGETESTSYINRGYRYFPQVEPQQYYEGELNPSVVTAKAPSIDSKEGRRAASNMARLISSGSDNTGTVPSSYRSYVEGELKGALPMSKYLSEEVAPDTLKAMAAAFAAPFAIGSLPAVGNAVPHVMKALANPLSAKTGIGAMAATAADAYGFVKGADQFGRDAKKIASGEFKVNDIPYTLLDATMLLPGSSVLTTPSNIGTITTGIDNIRRYKQLALQPSTYTEALEYARDKYWKRADMIDRNLHLGKGYSLQDALDPTFRWLEYPEDVMTTLPDVKFRGLLRGNLFGESKALGTHEPGTNYITLNPLSRKILRRAWKNPNRALTRMQGTAAHEGTHWALDRLGTSKHLVRPVFVKEINRYYSEANPNHPLYGDVTWRFGEDRPGINYWVRSPEEYVADMTKQEYLSGIPTDKLYNQRDISLQEKINDALGDRFKFSDKEEVEFITRSLSNFGYGKGGLLV